MDAQRRRLLRLGQLLLGAAVLWFIARALLAQWEALPGTAWRTGMRWDRVLLASALVVATYALLVQLWRVLLRAWGEHLGWGDAVRIWCVSNLGRYVPGRVWQIGAMAAMARAQGVSPVAAAGSALLNTAINVAASVAVVVLVGRDYLERQLPGGTRVAAALTILAVAGLVSLPWLLPPVVDWIGRRRGRPEAGRIRIPVAAVWLTTAGNLLAWFLYGAAFRWFTEGVLGSAPGGLLPYVSVYTGSYVLGYLSFFTVGGLGVREGALAGGMTALGLAAAPGALLVALASRLWLTVLEVLPGLVYLALSARRRGPSNSLRDVPS